jgi:hypothetical protein
MILSPMEIERDVDGVLRDIVGPALFTSGDPDASKQISPSPSAKGVRAAG